MADLPARERIILAIDTSSEVAAERLAQVAKEAGARFVKLGLELSSATSWQFCAELADSHGLDWVADAKLDDIPHTVGRSVANLRNLAHPPFGITMHITAGKDAMRAAQQEADGIRMLGVTVLTSIDDAEVRFLYGMPASQKVVELARYAAQVGGLSGVVASPLEVGLIKGDPATEHMLAMIPGTRSVTAGAQDQARVGTPAAAIRGGADLLVIGRQVTLAADPAQAYEALVAEISE